VRAALRHLAPGPDARTSSCCSSILARIAVPGYTGYSASKAGLLGLVRSFAAELAPQGVQVNAICPGWVDTDMAWLGSTRRERDRGTREELTARPCAVPAGAWRSRRTSPAPSRG
jgi:NAD(P)-dependent dehydrogenase (short-subunit alcohol dehydrogenase family)